MHLTPTEDIQDEPFVGVWKLHILRAYEFDSIIASIHMKLHLIQFD